MNKATYRLIQNIERLVRDWDNELAQLAKPSTLDRKIDRKVQNIKRLAQMWKEEDQK